MTQEEFNAFATELADKFKGSKTHWMVIVAPPGSFTGERGPHSAGNLDVPAQCELLRGIADSLERNAAVEIFRRRL